MKSRHLILLAVLLFSCAFIAGCPSEDSDDVSADGDTESTDGDAPVLDGDTVDCDVIDGDIVDCNVVDGDTADGDTVTVDGDIADGDTVDDDSETAPVTWFDAASGLTWQDPPSKGEKDWLEGANYCGGLDLAGQVDWRFPTISEFRSLIRGCLSTQTSGICGVTDSCLDTSCLTGGTGCADCFLNEGPTDGCYWPAGVEGPCSWFWSGSTLGDSAIHAWGVNFAFGSVTNNNKEETGYVRCVRGGSAMADGDTDHDGDFDGGYDGDTDFDDDGDE